MRYYDGSSFKVHGAYGGSSFVLGVGNHATYRNTD